MAPTGCLAWCPGSAMLLLRSVEMRPSSRAIASPIPSVSLPLITCSFRLAVSSIHPFIHPSILAAQAWRTRWVA